MTAYGALISLKNTLDYILYSSHFTIVDEPYPIIIEEAYDELQPFLQILERLDKTRLSRSRKKMNEVDGRIKDLIWEFEDKLESRLYQQIVSQVDGDGGMEVTSVLLESLPLQFQFQSPSPNTTNIQSKTRRKLVQVDGDERMEETSVWQFPGLLESLPLQLQFQSPPPPETSNIQRRRRIGRGIGRGKGRGRVVQVDGDGGRKSLMESSHIPPEYEFGSPPAEQVEPTTRRRRHTWRRKPIRRPEQVDGDGGRKSLSRDDVASFIQALKEMEKEYIRELEDMPQEPFSATIGFDYGQTKSKMIGLSDQFQKIKRKLIMRQRDDTYSYKIAGMGGIGKTTLAKEIYEDADVVSHFDRRAWVTVTRSMVYKGPQFDEVAQGIRAQLCDGDTLIQGDDYFKRKKCLIVLDDVWESCVWGSFTTSLLSIIGEFSCVLYTTRGISEFNNEDSMVRFLNEEESKDLLCHKVFGDKDLCPDQLHKAAAKIAKKCEGLPLTIVTVADILSKSKNTEPDYWNDVAEERNSVFEDAYKQVSEVLYPSYDYLPQSVKMPFLYMGVFPPDYEIPLSKLMNMLDVAGWFIDANRNIYFDDDESLKGAVRVCLYHCAYRHLVLFKKRSVYWCYYWFDRHYSMYKTCWLHSSWRYTCRKEARKKKFYHVLNHLLDALGGEGLKGHRRLCLQNNMLFGIKMFRNSVRSNCASFTRSLLFLGPYHQYPTPIDVGFRLLRELDALQLRFYTFPTAILSLVLLKYLALTCNGELPTTISKLFNLRVLIIHPHMSIRRCRAPSYVPTQIWDMKELEHIEILGKSLRVPNHVAPLKKLLTLVGVNASISTITVLSGRVPNIWKLDVRIELTPNNDHIDLVNCFARISTLESLKILKCSIINPVIRREYIVPAPPCSFMLPCGLRKLHLSGTGFPWEYMDVIGSLTYLNVLKLRSYAFRDSNWEAPQKGWFPRLQFLLIEDSDLRCLNLPPWLGRVSIKHCYKLERIHWPPWEKMGDRKIEIMDCSPLAMTLAKELETNGYAYIDVTIISHFEQEKPTITEFKRFGDSPLTESYSTFGANSVDPYDDQEEEEEDYYDEGSDDEEEVGWRIQLFAD